MLLKKCISCKNYTFSEECKKCRKKTISAHYKFIKIKDAPKSDKN